MNHSWVSQKSGGLYHLEDEERFDVHGGKFTASCGATGLFRSVRVDDGLIEFQKCETCLKFEDVAGQGRSNIEPTESTTVGDEGVSEKCQAEHTAKGASQTSGLKSKRSQPDSQSFSGSTIENLTRSVVDAEMRAGFKRNISASSELDPVYDANGRY